MSGVFRNIDPPPPYPRRVCTPPPLVRGSGGRTHSLSGKTPDTDLYSIYVSTLLCASYSVFCQKQYGGLVYEYHIFCQRYECSYFREQQDILMKILLANCTVNIKQNRTFGIMVFFLPNLHTC